MLRHTLSLLTALIATLLVGVAMAEPSDKTFVVSDAQGFKPVQPALEAYLQEQPRRPAGAQHFCVIGYEVRDGERMAFVHWREGHRLILWEPRIEEVGSQFALIDSRRDLDLRRDVVATPEQMDGSTYMVDRPWLQRQLADCRRRGQVFVVRNP